MLLFARGFFWKNWTRNTGSERLQLDSLLLVGSSHQDFSEARDWARNGIFN